MKKRIAVFVKNLSSGGAEKQSVLLQRPCQNDTIMKAFTDFFMISRSKKVYRIISKELYCTTFSMYAAISGYCDFETVDLEKEVILR